MLDLDKIREMAAGAEYHLKKIEEFADNLREVINSLHALRRAQEDSYRWELNLLRQEFTDIKLQLKKYGLPEANKYERNLQHLRENIESDQWPQAVRPEAICLSEEQIKQRSNNILDIIVGEHLEDKRFLDFGCGDGMVVLAAMNRKPRLAIGYDVDLSQCGVSENFTHDFNIIQQHAPYDIILLHDVLDHIVQVDPVTALHMVGSVLDKNGRVYVRNHPWSSRHGGHLYKSVNKAYLHLILDEVELTRVGGWECDHNIKVVRPLETYRDWFSKSGLNVRTEVPIRRGVEDFFTRASHVSERLLLHWGDRTEMQQNMEIEFAEYVCQHATTPKIY